MAAFEAGLFAGNFIRRNLAVIMLCKPNSDGL